MAGWHPDQPRRAVEVRLMVVLASLSLLALTAMGQQSGSGSPSPQELPPVRLGSELVRVPVTVTDRYDRLVTRLRKRDFRISDDRLDQRIAFFIEEDAPITIGIVFDLSGSMKRRRKTRQARLALRRFIDTSHPDDDFFLIGFNQRLTLLQDFTSGADEIVNRLALRTPGGRTALYDACTLAVEKAAQGRHPRRALLILSDGLDNASRYTFRQLRDLVRETGVQIYAIGIPASFSYYRQFPSDIPWGNVILSEITSLTGGRAFVPASSFELDDVVTRIALELRHQYSLGFYPSSTAFDGGWRRIRVKVRAIPGLRKIHVRAREGYYAKK